MRMTQKRRKSALLICLTTALISCLLMLLYACTPSKTDVTSEPLSDSSPEQSETSSQESNNDSVFQSDRLTGSVCAVEYVGNSLVFIDPDTGELLGRVGIGSNPAAISVSNDSQQLYVADYGSGEIAHAELGKSDQAKRVRIGTQPIALELDEESSTLYVADYFLNGIRVVDTNLKTLVDTIALNPMGYESREVPPPCCYNALDGAVIEGRKPVSLALSPDKKILYCANIGTYDVARIDLEAKAELEPFDGVIGARDILVTPDGNFLLLAGVGSDLIESKDLLVLDAKTGAVVHRVEVGPEVSGVAQSDDGATVIAISKGSGNICVIDSATWSIRNVITLEPGVVDIALNRQGSHAFISNSDTGSITSLNLQTLETHVLIEGLADPRFLAIV